MDISTEFLCIAVHGGAGVHSTMSSQVQAIRKGLIKACNTVWTQSLLHQTTCPLDLCVESTSVLEDDENFNAGFGSNLTFCGAVECDAAVMIENGHFGSVGAVAGVRNPVRAAKLILDYSQQTDSIGRVPPLTLVASGAQQFVQARYPSLIVDPSTMSSDTAERDWSRWKERLTHGSMPERHSYSRSQLQDTVGSVVMNDIGGAASVSSGGLLLKHSGRVGEAAVFGAGCYAARQEETSPFRRRVACSVSGTGEEIIRAGLARAICESFLNDLEEDADVHAILEKLLPSCGSTTPTTPVDVGALVMTREGQSRPRLWCAFTSESMAIAFMSSNHAKPKAMILRRELSGHSALPSPRLFITSYAL